MSIAPAPLDAPDDTFDAAAFQRAFGASESQMADLNIFRDLLFDWNTRMNLVGPSAAGAFWRRHVLDSAQLLNLAPDNGSTWADLGAGAGFPGLVLAILLKGRVNAGVHLVESMAKRCRFLQTVVDTLELAAHVHHARAESLSLKVDVVTARACAPMSRLLGYAWPYLRSGATGLFLKGQDVGPELQEAAIYWKFEADLIPSMSYSEGRIVRLKKVTRVRSG
jgi:16S rRNA (guanine527-N7)-methyltransferase